MIQDVARLLREISCQREHVVHNMFLASSSLAANGAGGRGSVVPHQAQGPSRADSVDLSKTRSVSGGISNSEHASVNALNTPLIYSTLRFGSRASIARHDC